MWHVLHRVLLQGRLPVCVGGLVSFSLACTSRPLKLCGRLNWRIVEDIGRLNATMGAGGSGMAAFTHGC